MFGRFFGKRRRRRADDVEGVPATESHATPPDPAEAPPTPVQADLAETATPDVTLPRQTRATPAHEEEYLRRLHDRVPVDPDAFDELAAQVLSAHFEGGLAEGKVASLGPLEVNVRCEVGAVQQFGQLEAASLFLEMSGGALGQEPVFASVSGYGESAAAAVIGGACTWACSFGPVLRSGLAGVTPEGDMDELQVTLDAQPYRVHVNGFDRVLHFTTDADDDASMDLAAQVRSALVPPPEDPWERRRPWLSEALVRSGRLPALTSRHTVLSVFVMDMEGQRTVEVKVNGSDWPIADWLEDTTTRPDGAVVLLRELAVLTSVSATGARVSPSLSREAVERTLLGLAARTEPGRVGGWQGWWSHEGWLGSPLTEDDLTAVERRTHQLPQDYRQFLTTIAGPGAGPGYGLLQPERVTSARADVIPLAHAGCGVTWVLRLDGRHRGEVWVDAAGSDQRFEHVASSVTEWFTSWLDLSVRDRSFVHWDPDRCATAQALSQLTREASLPIGASLRDRLDDGSISLTLGEGYLPDGAAGDPCQGCVELAASRGLSPAVFAPGILSRPV